MDKNADKKIKDLLNDENNESQTQEEKNELLEKLAKEVENNNLTDKQESTTNDDELSDEEKRELYIKALKKSRIKFKNTVHDGKVTHTKFDTNYKKKRRKRNKLAKKSRKINRK